MSAQKCIDTIRTAMGDATDDEVLRMATEANQILQERVGQSTEEIMAAVDRLMIDESIAKKIEGRNKALNAVAKRNIEQFVDSFGENYLEGLEATLVGTNRTKMGARRSVAAMQSQLQESYLAGITADIEASGHFDLFTDGRFDDDIARALWQIDNGDNFTGIAKEAVDLARIIHKWQEVSRIDANEAGAWIGKMPGYITRQSHDMDKIRKAGFDRWVQDIAPLLDERTFDDVADRDAFLKSVYDGLSTGVHLGNGSVGNSAALKGFRNIARGMSKERVLHFADADSWLSYNSKYGRGELRDSVFGGLMMSAQNTGLMKILGPNAELNFESVIDALKSKHRGGDPDTFKKFTDAIKPNSKIRRYFSAVDGSMNIPGGDNMWGAIGGSVRAINSITMLGKAVISSIADIPVSASEMRYQGQNFLQAYGGALKNAGGAVADMGRSIGNRKLTVKSVQHRRALAELGISLDATTGMFTNRFDMSQDMPGRLSDALNRFFRWNGLTIWTDSVRAGSMIGMANHVAAYSGMDFGRLPRGLQDTLTLYGIGKGEWSLISKAGTQQMEGVDGSFVTPDMIKRVSDEDIKAHLESIGTTPTEYQIKKTRNDIAESLRTYYVDRSQYAVIEPDTKTRAMMQQGTQPGTITGEVWRAIMQFKAFPIAIIQKVWGREIYGRAGTTSSIKGLAEFMVMGTLAGYMAMTAKDLAKNRTPRDPTDPKTMLAAFLQGGGAGIYGDFLFGDVKNRFGGSAISTLAGPTASQFDSIMNIWGQMREGDVDAGKSAFRFIYQNAPSALAAYHPAASLLNAGYTKAVLDNLIYYNVMEALSPGYKRRMERRMKKENDQEYLIK